MKKSILRIISLVAIFILASFFFSSSVSLAGSGLVPCGVTNPCTLCHFIIGFHSLVLYGVYLVVSVALLALFFTGVAYILSSGNEGLMTTAKGFLKGSFIGFSVVLGGFLIVTAALWVVSAKGDLGVSHTGGWASFTCNVASTALNPVTTPSSTPPAVGATAGTALTPGTAGASCGNNNLGRCEPALPGGGFNNNPCLQPGKQEVGGGTGCNSGLWCCANLLSAGTPCSAMGRAGTCATLYGTGGSATEALVCPAEYNRSWRMEQATSYDVNCASGLGCCSNDNPPAPGILYSPCGTGGAGTCAAVTGTFILSSAACASLNPQQVAVSGGDDCQPGLWCCAAPGAGPVNTVPDITP